MHSTNKIICHEMCGMWKSKEGGKWEGDDDLTVQMSAGTRMMMEREENQVYPTVRRTQRGTSGPAKYLRVNATIPSVKGSEIRQKTHISLSLDRPEKGLVLGVVRLSRTGRGILLFMSPSRQSRLQHASRASGTWSSTMESIDVPNFQSNQIIHQIVRPRT